MSLILKVNFVISAKCIDQSGRIKPIIQNWVFSRLAGPHINAIHISDCFYIWGFGIWRQRTSVELRKSENWNGKVWHENKTWQTKQAKKGDDWYFLLFLMDNASHPFCHSPLKENIIINNKLWNIFWNHIFWSAQSWEIIWLCRSP